MADKNYYYLNLVQRHAAAERDADRVAVTSMNLHSYLNSKIRSRKVEVEQDAVEDEWEYQREYER